MTMSAVTRRFDVGVPAICIDARHAKAALDMARNKMVCPGWEREIAHAATGVARRA